MAPTLQRVLVLAALCLTGCGAASSSARPTPPTARRDRREPARSSPAADPSPAAKPRLPTAFRRPRRASGPIPAAHGRVAGAHILITYAGAIRARPRVPRGRAAARALAAQLARRLCPRPS
ncbi:MAG: hypothetical protein KC503_02980, partial [Myxococcales bacterium]|nr:hypothetical protein [Myxococcales bacterium]